MASSVDATPYRFVVLSSVKHDYIPHGVAAHPRCVPVVVADDADQPDFVHERNEKLAGQLNVPYVRDVQRAVTEFDARIAVVSSEAERHCDLSLRAASAGLHVIQDKPMSTRLSECDRLVEAVQRNGIKFLLWNRNCLPAVLQADEAIQDGAIGKPYAIHVDFYFAKDAGPAKGTRGPDDPPINWLQRQIEAHADGSDGGLGSQAMGELQVEGIYPLAYIRMLTGASVRRVFARTTSHFHQAHVDNNVDDLATVTLHMDHGIVGSLCIGRIGAASHPDIGEIKIHVLGSRGGLVISESRPEVAIYYRGQPRTEYPHMRIAQQNDFLLVDDFLRAIETDGETILDARAGRDICATVEAAIESGRTGEPRDVAVLSTS